jgi:hypothetical protein
MVVDGLAVRAEESSFFRDRPRHEEKHRNRVVCGFGFLMDRDYDFVAPNKRIFKI